MYGPTEATIISAVLKIDRDVYRSYRDLTSVPIGRPAANLDLYVLDRYYKLCPINILGELYILGEGVARGYLNNPELTAEKFVISHLSLVISHSKFSPNDQCPMTNDRLYKTGDLARWLGDGTIEYMGRIDQQVKIRGFRIEPGEIESCLRGISGIKEAVVIEREGMNKEKYLCAYVVVDESSKGDLEIGGDKAFEIDAAKIKEILSRNLPDYMIPQYFVRVDQIPLNPNGKIDIKRLPEPKLSEKQYIGPSNEVERRLVEIWGDVLTIEPGKISIDADFFELGGHSLKATIMISRIQHAMNVELMLVEIFKYSTIREIAKLINALNFRKRVSVKIGASEKKVERIVI
jgi:acyl-CoA synthetase (AMP-forming)/AMP-acid ligase II/acyl carrier protein